MEKKYLNLLKEKLLELDKEDKKQRDLYLRGLATGEIQGPPVGYPSIDKPWLKNYPPDAITAELPEKTIYEYLKESIEDEPDRVLIDFLGKKITAKEILENIDKYAEDFEEKGVKPNDVVALSFPSIPEAVYSIYALSKIGAVACNIDPRISEKDLENDIKNSKATVFIGINTLSKKLKNIVKNYNFKNVTLIDPLQSVPSSNKDVKLFIAKTLSKIASLVSGKVEVDRNYQDSSAVDCVNMADKDCKDDLAVIVHTGGTTGIHKGVYLSNNALNSTVYEHKYWIDDVGPGSTMYNPLPTFMSYGMTTLHLALCNKLYMYMMPLSSPKTFGKEMVKLQPEIIYGGPIHYQAGRKNKEIKEKGLPNAKIAVSGGEKLTANEEKINEDFYKLANGMYNGYGASELCGVFSLKKGKKNTSGSVGIPMPWNNVQIVDSNTGEELGYDKIGSVLLTGRSLMLGYTDDEETAKVMDGEWFKPEDNGYVNKDGEIFITGRSKRQFVSGVDKVYCPTVEEAIEALPEVEKCVVVGVTDDVLRKAPYAYVIRSDGYINSDEQSIINRIKATVDENVSKTSIPKYFNFSSAMQYTPNGKIDFDRMEKMAEEEITHNFDIQNGKVKALIKRVK